MTVADVEHPHAHARFVRGAPGPFAIAAVEAPWGPIQVAATADAVVGLSVLSPPDLFATVVARRTRRERPTGAVAKPFRHRAAASTGQAADSLRLEGGKVVSLGGEVVAGLADVVGDRPVEETVLPA